MPAGGRRGGLRVPPGGDSQRPPIGPRAALSHASGPTATLNMLEAARQAGVRRFLFAASSSAYGETTELPKHEDMLPQPLSPYAAGKLAGEAYVFGLRAHDGAGRSEPAVFQHLRAPPRPFEPLQRRDLHLCAADVPGSSHRPSIGDGTQTRDFTYVANVVAANLAAMRHPQPLEGAVYNVGTGRRISLLDLVAAINRFLGTDIEPEFRPARAGDVRDSQASLERIREKLNYRPIVDFEEGLRLSLARSVHRCRAMLARLSLVPRPAWRRGGRLHPPPGRLVRNAQMGSGDPCSSPLCD